ncbi:helix-hairpin-helix domain-containing protein [Cellulosimicrobium cellulans]|uniref:helix-hairpin-helix domain-containing protein n=1 Tax=Cellulosimicrobium cellulans TaxID=1710 RepID=UPI00240516AB|nr:helix-hairpin-helix domain-containing protein [Cellulosimicrobium cellulans]
MSTLRPEPRQHARPARDPVQEGEAVRQRLRAVTGTGRPARAWHPATATLPQVGPPGDLDAAPDVGPWPDGLGTPVLGPGDDGAAPTPGGEASEGRGEPPVPEESDRRGRGRARGPDETATGWLPSRPDVDESSRADVTGAAGTDDAGRAGAASPGDAEVDRLRFRAARTAATAYTATYGHPTSHAGFAGLGEEGRRRWALRPRTAVVALVVVLLLAAGVVLLRSPAGGVTPLAPLDATPIAAPATDPEAESVAPAGAGATTDGGTAEPAATGGGEGADTEGAPSGGVVVHVVGQVAAPGLVTVAADARVADALEAAGGATAEADLAALNLARTVTDGEQIVVPRPGEAVPPSASAPPAAGTTAGGAVDLNAADAAALDALPGIGPVLAERIVAWREENGPFTAVDELGEVSGIGPAVLADVRDLVRV